MEQLMLDKQDKLDALKSRKKNHDKDLEKVKKQDNDKTLKRIEDASTRRL